MNLSKKLVATCCSALLTANLLFCGIAAASTGLVKTYTNDADFLQGTSINLSNKIPDQLQLDDTTKPFGFIWVAVSTKGTVVKIDTETGKVLGEYKTAPDGQPMDPSRTTVDKNGSVWVANRAGNSVTRICLPESGLWIDKNGNGKCDTSVGSDDIKPWTNVGGADTNGGVSTADDECIINYVRVSSSGTRHVSVDANNDVWVSGIGGQVFDLIDDKIGSIKRTEGPVGYGGYGGLIDENGVIWSTTSGSLLRWNTSSHLTQATRGVAWDVYAPNSGSYGLARDKQGNIWNTSYGEGIIRKFASDGTLLGTYNQGYPYAQGCVADSNGDIWVAHSLSGNTVGHLKNDGTYVGAIRVGNGPTGVAVDANGKIWATNYSDGTVSRIDPSKGPIGSDGVTPVGEVDFTSGYLGGNLYNYSDMTGSTLIGAPNLGSWSVKYDSGAAGTEWGLIDWSSLLVGDGTITVTVESSDDGVSFSPKETVSDGSDMTVPNGRYLKVTVNFKRATTGESPILYDLTIKTAGSDNVQLGGRMTGGGSIFSQDGIRVTHGFSVDSNLQDSSNNLQVNWGKGNQFHVSKLTKAVLVYDPNIDAKKPTADFNTFTGEGMGSYNGKEGFVIEFTFTDAGEPGTKDSASIIIKDPDGKVVLAASGNLDKGNQQAHSE